VSGELRGIKGRREERGECRSEVKGREGEGFKERCG
jgi:hypothetical protein